MYVFCHSKLDFIVLDQARLINVIRVRTEEPWWTLHYSGIWLRNWKNSIEKLNNSFPWYKRRKSVHFFHSVSISLLLLFASPLSVSLTRSIGELSASCYTRKPVPSPRNPPPPPHLSPHCPRAICLVCILQICQCHLIVIHTKVFIMTLTVFAKVLPGSICHVHRRKRPVGRCACISLFMVPLLWVNTGEHWSNMFRETRDLYMSCALQQSVWILLFAMILYLK